MSRISFSQLSQNFNFCLKVWQTRGSMQNGWCAYRWTALSASRDVQNVGPANFSTSTSEFLIPVSPPVPWFQPPLALSRVARIFITSPQRAPKPHHLHTQAMSPLAYLSFMPLTLIFLAGAHQTLSQFCRNLECPNLCFIPSFSESASIPLTAWIEIL